jgi:hypothetical protein
VLIVQIQNFSSYHLMVNSANCKATINSEIIQDFIAAFFNGFCYFYLRSVATLLDELIESIMLFLSDEYI